MWEAKPPTFWKAFRGPQGRPDFKNAPKQKRPDCLQVLRGPIDGQTYRRAYSGVQHVRFPFWGPLDLRFRGPLEAKSFVRGRKIDPPGAPGRVFDLKCASCGHVRPCTSQSLVNYMVLRVVFIKNKKNKKTNYGFARFAKSTPNDPGRTSDQLKLQPHDL